MYPCQNCGEPMGPERFMYCSDNCQAEAEFIQEIMDEDHAIMQPLLDEEKRKKDQHYRELKKLLNVKKVWAYMEDDSWNIEGVFSGSLEYKYNYDHQGMYPHLKIEGFPELRRQRSNKSESGVTHLFIKQYSSGEDSYHGYMAFPLRDRKFLVVSYAC